MSLPLVAAPQQVSPYEWQNVSRLLVIGDVHGALAQLRNILQAAELVDAEDQWIGGESHLLSLGDLIDRGADSRAVLDYFMRLQGQAEAAGGRVHVILGNHEVMNLLGNLQDVSEAELASYGGHQGHAVLFADTGRFGQWLSTLPSMLKVNDSLFAHGGISSIIDDLNLAEVNASIQQAIATLRQGSMDARLFLEQQQEQDQQQEQQSQGGKVVEHAQRTTNLLALADELLTLPQQRWSADLTAFIQAAQNPVLNSDGPHWYRGNAACHPLLESTSLRRLLDQFAVRRIVIGHTPTPGRTILSRLDDQVIAADTGMLAAVYKGRPQALEITTAGLIVIDQSGTRTQPQPARDPLLHSAAHLQALRTAPVLHIDHSGRWPVLTLQGQLAAQFVSMSKKQAQQAVAAYRLSEMLGMDMVAATVLREVDGQWGILEDVSAQLSGRRLLSEQQRQEGAYRRPNYCQQGSDYSLLSAFDSLIGKRDRSADNLYYEIPTWEIRVKDNGVSFDTSRRANSYSEVPAIPELLRQRLENLTLETLSGQLSDMLSPRQIKAILKRRDAILEWPVLAR